MTVIPSLFLILPLALGWSFISCFTYKQRLPFTFMMALSYGIGTGFLSLWMLFIGMMDIPFGVKTINYPLIFFIIIFLSISILLQRKHPNPVLINLKEKSSINALSIIILLYIAYRSYIVFWFNYNIPLMSWDAFSTNVFKSKIFFIERSLKYLSTMPHPSYPLHLELLQAWIGISINSWNDLYIKAIFPFYFISILTVVYHFLRSHTNTTWSLLGIAMLVSSNILISHACVCYRDMLMMFYCVTPVLLIILWFKYRINYLLLFGGLFSGIGAFLKLEGTGYLLVHLILLLTALWLIRDRRISSKIKYFFIFALPSLFICAIFHAYNYIAISADTKQAEGIQYSFNLSSTKLLISKDVTGKLFTVIKEIANNLMFSNNWSLVWIVFIFSLILGRLKLFKKPEIFLILTAQLLFFSIQIAGYTLTQYFVWIANSNVSLSRHLLHHFALAPILIVLLLYPYNKNNTIG